MHNASDKDIWRAQERDPATFQEEDVVGAGRYILSFILAGFIGLGIQKVCAGKAGQQPGLTLSSS